MVHNYHDLHVAVDVDIDIDIVIDIDIDVDVDIDSDGDLVSSSPTCHSPPSLLLDEWVQPGVVRPVVEQSEEDHDPALVGYMNSLKNALRTLPAGLKIEVKAEVGADRVDVTTRASPALSPAATAVSAVTAAAGQLVGGIWGGAGRSSGRGISSRKGGREAWADGGRGERGLVRELVEHCLFSLPREKGAMIPETNEDGSIADSTTCDGDEVGRGHHRPVLL